MRYLTTALLFFCLLLIGIFPLGCSTADQEAALPPPDMENFENFGSMYNFDKTWGSEGNSQGQFLKPCGIFADQNHVYVVDNGNNRIQKFDTNGDFLLQWGEHGGDPGQFISPTDIVVDTSGSVYVLDLVSLQKFTSEGVIITRWPHYEFAGPWGLAVDSGQNMFILDFPKSKVHRFTADGSFVSEWGVEGSGPGEFHRPIGITIDSNDTVFIADTMNNRIQKYDRNGKFLEQWGSAGTADGQFQRPFDVDVHLSGLICVVEYFNHRVQVFNNKGVFETKFGSQGSGNGEFRNPRACCFNPQGDIFVVDTNNHRIQKFVK